MSEDNNESQYRATTATHAAEAGDDQTAENAVAHGGKFGSDETLAQKIDESQENYW